MSITAHEYHQFMSGSSFDRPIRSAFHRTVYGLLRPGGTILDFGSGTGIDSKFYVEHGYKVRTYDASLEMREYLASHCRNEIETGAVSIIDLDYPTFLGTSPPSGERVDAITANFAVLNLVEDHAQLFKTFDRWLAPDGFIFASLLSPYYIHGAWHWRWWLNMVRLARAGEYSIGTDGRRTHRPGLRSLRRAAYPHFVLSRVIEQANTPQIAAEEAASITRSASTASLFTRLYMFLLFQRPGGRGRL